MKNEFIKKMIVKGMIEDLKEETQKRIEGIKKGIKKLNRKKEELKNIELLENTSKKIAYGCIKFLNAKNYTRELNDILTLKNDFMLEDLNSIVKIGIFEGLKNKTIILLNNVFFIGSSTKNKIFNELQKFIYKNNNNRNIQNISFEFLKEEYQDFLEFNLQVENFQIKKTAIKKLINYEVIQEKLKLTNKQIEILKLFLNGLNQSQVASITGYTRGDCYTAFSRVLKKFKKYYNVEV